MTTHITAYDTAYVLLTESATHYHTRSDCKHLRGEGFDPTIFEVALLSASPDSKGTLFVGTGTEVPKSHRRKILFRPQCPSCRPK